MKKQPFSEYAIRDDLGLLDDIWRGWMLRHGQLFDPWHSSTVGYRPEEIRCIPYLHQTISALKVELRKLKSPEREPRQLTNLSRPAQAPEPPRTHLATISWRAQAPVSVRIGPGPVRANPARHKRSLP